MTQKSTASRPNDCTQVVIWFIECPSADNLALATDLQQHYTTFTNHYCNSVSELHFLPAY